jgi:four helix bundle protein
MKSFRDLQVWEKSHCLTLAVYSATAGFPREEQYGLTSQIRRASASIPANIAEGCGRTGDNELRRFMEIAMGSASELEYHLLLVKDLKILDERKYSELSQQTCEVKRMLAAFILKLKGKAVSSQHSAVSQRQGQTASARSLKADR